MTYLLWLVIVMMVWWSCRYVMRVFFPTRRAPYISSFDRQLAFLRQSITVKQWAKVLDLWCGDGKALRVFARTFGCQAIGYDRDIWALVIARCTKLWTKDDIAYVRGDFSDADFTDIDIVYCYLWPSQNKTITDWLFASINEDCVVVSNSFPFDREATEIIESDHKRPARFYLYTKQWLSKLPKTWCVQVTI